LSNPAIYPFDSVARARRLLRESAMRTARRALPQACALCAAPAGIALVCPACTAALPRLLRACPVCALPHSTAGRCGACIATPPPFEAAVASFVYAFPVDRLLHELKYAGRLAYAEWAAAELAASVAPTLDARPDGRRIDLVAAIPLSPVRQRERGFNQALEIARRVARALDVPLGHVVDRPGGGTPQAQLSWSERVRNVRGAFACRRDVRGLTIALVDDVMTTGATLAEAATTLKRAGAARIEAWAVARTLPPAAA